MADTPDNQREYPQQSIQAESHRLSDRGIVVVFSLAVGAVVEVAIGPYEGKQTGENNLFRRLLDSLPAGRSGAGRSILCVLLGLCVAAETPASTWCAQASSRKIDFRTGLKLGRRRPVDVSIRSRRRPCLDGSADVRAVAVARWDSSSALSGRPARFSPAGHPAGDHAGGSDRLSGGRPGQPLSPSLGRRTAPAKLKTHMQMERLRCKKPSTVRKEFYAHLLAYNLIRGLMLEAALSAGVAPHQLSFKGAMQSINAFLGLVIADSRNADRLYAALLWMIGSHRVADRPDRIEPRLVKRRPKQYKHLREPRRLARKRLMHRR